MYSNYKRIGCFMLVLVLCFCVLANPIVQPKAQAVAGAAVAVAGVGALTIIVYLLGALGITAGSKGTIHQLAEGVAGEISKADPTLFSWLNEQVISNTASGQPIWSPIFTGVSSSVMVSKLVMWVMKIVGKNKAATGKTTVDVVDESYMTYGDVKVYPTVPSADGLFGSDGVFFTNTESNPYVMTSDLGYTYKYYLEYNTSTLRPILRYSVITPSGLSSLGNLQGDSSDFIQGDYRYWTNVSMRFSFNIVTDASGNKYLNPFLIYSGNDYYNKPVTRIKSESTLIAGINNLIMSFPLSDESLAYGKQSINYQELISYELAQMRLGLTEKLNEILAAVGSISIPMDEPYSDVVEGKAERDKERDGIPYVPGIPVTDWAKIWEQLKLGEKVTAKDPAIPIQQEQDLDVQTLPDVRDKFPFCVPFDLIALVKALQAKAEAPKFTIPFHIKSLGYEENFVLDFTGWERVAVVIRWGTTIMFLLGLTMVTRKMIKG